MGAHLLVVGALSLALAFTANALTVAQGTGAGETVRERQEVRTTGTEPEDGVRVQEREREMVGDDTKDESEDGVEVENEVESEAEDAMAPGTPKGAATGTARQEVRERETDRAGTPPGVAVAEERRSAVADAVQELLGVADRSGGIGEQVRTIAREQESNRLELETSLANAEKRGGFLKFLIGPNYGEIKNAEALLERNREQVQTLLKLKENAASEEAKSAIEDQVQTLQRADVAVEESLREVGKGFSLFGWAFSLFSR